MKTTENRGRPRTRVKLFCENCNAVFEKKLSEFNSNNHHFCCYCCRVEWLNKNKKKVRCDWCDKEFSTNEKRERKYCSRKCFDEAKGRVNFGESQFVCDGCGKEFVRATSKAAMWEKSYCSMDCYNKCRTGEGNPNYKVDRSSLKTTKNKRLRNSTLMDEWREAVFERDNYTCQKCGKRGGILNAHHIKRLADYPELAYDVDNGATLCEEPCHKEVNGNEELFEESLNTKKARLICKHLYNG